MLDKAKAMKQAWDFQRALKKKTIKGRSPNKEVIILANGVQEVLKVKISEDLMSPDKRKDLQEAIKDAFNNLQDNMKDSMKDEMPNLGSLFGG